MLRNTLGVCLTSILLYSFVIVPIEATVTGIDRVFPKPKRATPPFTPSDSRRPMDTLVVRLSDRHDSKTSLCQYIQTHPAPRKEHYHSTIGPWLQARLDEWHRNNTNYRTAHGFGFFDYLTDRYAPLVTASTKRCNLEHKCTIPSCQDYSEDFEIEEQFNAYHALESIFNLVSSYMIRLEANEEAYGQISIRHMIDKYADLSNHREHQHQVEMHQKLAIGATIALALVVAPLVGPAAPMVGLGATVSAVVPTVVSSMVGLLSGMNGIGGVLFTIRSKKPEKIKDELAEGMDKVMMQQKNLTQFVIRLCAEKVLKGDVDLGNNSLATLVGSGDYIKGEIHDNTYNNKMQNYWFALYLGIIWRAERTYIVMADAKSGCSADRRGPQHLKICLKQYPDKSFYIYFVPRVREGTLHQALVRGPPGHLNIIKESGITVTLDDVVEASVQSYMNNKRQDTKLTDRNDLETVQYDQWFGKKAVGGPYAGLFSIPVCRNPDGGPISSVNRETSRNYPCMCGENPWHDKKNWDYGRDETPAFLEATGLVLSGDWEKFCDARCKKAHKHDYDFKGPHDSGMKHPFDTCDTTRHVNTGCETDKGNGYKNFEEDCTVSGASRRKTGT